MLPSSLSGWGLTCSGQGGGGYTEALRWWALQPCLQRQEPWEGLLGNCRRRPVLLSARTGWQRGA